MGSVGAKCATVPHYLPMFTKDGNIIIFSEGMGGIEIPFDSLIQAIVVLSIGVLIIVTK